MSVIETLRKEGADVLTGLQLLIGQGIEKRLSTQ